LMLRPLLLVPAVLLPCAVPPVLPLVLLRLLWRCPG
jgi:hypothetical protein